MGWRDFEIPTYHVDKTDRTDKSIDAEDSVSKNSFVTSYVPKSKSIDEVAGDLRNLSPNELAKLDLTLRIVAPDAADSWSLQDWLEWISERAAILEFDADQSHEQANAEAFLIWRLYRKTVGL